jgi:hypothetical protein
LEAEHSLTHSLTHGLLPLSHPLPCPVLLCLMSDEVAARESQSATLTTDLSGSEGVSEWLRPAAHQKLLGALCHSHTHSLPPSLACPTHCPIQGLPPTPACSTLRLHGWRYEAALSVDRNHMNLACLLARNSNCTDGE